MNAAVPRIDARGARRERRATAASVAQAAAELDRHAELAGDPPQVLEVDAARPPRAPSRSTTCRQRAPASTQRARRRQRVVVVDRLAPRSRP